MNKDDIIRMAREAGLKAANYPSMVPDSEWETLGKFIALVAAHEREACATVCDEMASRDKLSNYYAVAAKAIRARGNT